jgi:hypothetical protein
MMTKSGGKRGGEWNYNCSMYVGCSFHDFITTVFSTLCCHTAFNFNCVFHENYALVQISLRDIFVSVFHQGNHMVESGDVYCWTGPICEDKYQTNQGIKAIKTRDDFMS